jgi:hypothetical protein
VSTGSTRESRYQFPGSPKSTLARKDDRRWAAKAPRRSASEAGPLGEACLVTKRSKAPEKVTIKIPRPLYEKISLVIEGAGYNSVTDFVVYLLRDIVSTHRISDHEPYSEEDVKLVKERLRSLGYLPDE